MIELSKTQKSVLEVLKNTYKKDTVTRAEINALVKKKYDLQTIGFYLVAKYRELQYTLRVPYNKELLARKMFNKNKFIADYSKAYDVYFYVNSGTRVANQVFDSKENTTNKRTLKKMFMSGMKNKLNSRVLLQNFIKEIA